jgi:hypothetical protein
MKVTWREGTLLETPKDMSGKALEMGVCFHSGPAFGKHEGVLFLRAFERKNLILRNFGVDFKRYVKMFCKQISLNIADLVGELGESSIAGTFEREKKYIWFPFLDPEGIKILSLGAIWKFSKGTELHCGTRLWSSKGLSVRPWCIGTVTARIHCQ